jgi:hypothetical protein
MNKKTLLALLGIGISAIMLLYSLWQLDVICKDRVWDPWDRNISFYNWLKFTKGCEHYSDLRFQSSELWVTNVGRAYDTLMSMAVVSWFLLLGSLFYLFYNERQKVNRLKKEILYLKETSRISSSEGQ